MSQCYFKLGHKYVFSDIYANVITWNRFCDVGNCFFYYVFTQAVTCELGLCTQRERASILFYSSIYIVCISGSRLTPTYCRLDDALYNASKITHQQNSPEQQ